MKPPIELREWGPAEEVEVGPSERRSLSRLAEKLAIQWVGANRVRIGPKAGYVGLASLSPDLQVVVRPKVPVTALLDLIALAYRIARLPRSVGEAALTESEPTEWLALLLVAEIEHLLEQGLRSGYVEVREDIPYVRGRIAFEALHRTLSRPVERTCEFADYLPDTPENRLIRGTLELLSVRRLRPAIKLRIASTLQAFRDVGLIRPSPSSFGELRVSRLNRYYEPALRLCQLFLQGSGVEADHGDVVAPAFFVPMETIFERAVANALRESIGRNVHHGAVFSDRFRHVSGGPPLTISFRPDVLLGPQAQPFLVLDTKYLDPIREHRGGPGFSNPNVYQIVTYCAALGCPGMLLYPRVSEDVHVTYEVDGVRLTLRTVDLTRPGLTGLRAFAAEMGRVYARTA